VKIDIEVRAMMEWARANSGAKSHRIVYKLVES